MSKDREWFPDTCTDETCWSCNQGRDCHRAAALAAIRQAKLRAPFRVRHPWVVIAARVVIAVCLVYLAVSLFH